MKINSDLDKRVIDNFRKIKLWLLIPSFLLLALLGVYFLIYTNDGNYIDSYINTQKDLFFYLNYKLSMYPNFQLNLTQLGDVLIIFPLLTVFMVYAPKLWEALLTSAIISLVVSATLKKIFAVPRPAAVFDSDSFVIIGKTLSGHTSLPSGHSIVTFIVATIILLAFMPRKDLYKIMWSFIVLTIGLIVAFSRVGVGAHYPLDIIIGSAIGYIIAIIGIKISNNIAWLHWMKNKKYYFVLILLLSTWIFFVVNKIISQNLLIFYLSLISLVITIYLMTIAYVKKD